MKGYDGVEFAIGDRIELHPGCDFWARGARFGVVVGTSLTPQDRVHVVLDRVAGRKFSFPEDRCRKAK